MISQLRLNLIWNNMTEIQSEKKVKEMSNTNSAVSIQDARGITSSIITDFIIGIHYNLYIL